MSEAGHPLLSDNCPAAVCLQPPEPWRWAPEPMSALHLSFVRMAHSSGPGFGPKVGSCSPSTDISRGSDRSTSWPSWRPWAMGHHYPDWQAQAVGGLRQGGNGMPRGGWNIAPWGQAVFLGLRNPSGSGRLCLDSPIERDMWRLESIRHAHEVPTHQPNRPVKAKLGMPSPRIERVTSSCHTIEAF